MRSGTFSAVLSLGLDRVERVPDDLLQRRATSLIQGTDTTTTRLRATTVHLSAAPDAIACADACGVNLPEAVANLTDRAFMIVIQDFHGPVQPQRQAADEVLRGGDHSRRTADPVLRLQTGGLPEQVREQMSGVPVADVVPNARPLQHALVDSPHGSKIARPATSNGDLRVDHTNAGRRVR